MAKVVRIRNVPDDLHGRLKARAARAGISMSDYVLGELRQALDRPTRGDVLERIAALPPIEVDPPSADAVREERLPRRFRGSVSGPRPRREEVRTMLAETVEEWTAEWVEQGREQGVHQGVQQVEPKAVVERLKEFGQTRGRSDWDELDMETRGLIRESPFAFLLAVAFDRGMPWQKAWRIPMEIDRQGLLDPALLASKSEAELTGLLDSLAVRPRYGAKQGARTLSDAARLVWERFGGDAGAIWRDSSPAEVEKTLQEIHGLGAGIASMTTRILRDDFGCFRGQERQIDVKPDVHLVRVFRRVGIIDGDSPNEAIRAARRLNPEFPGELDWPAWSLGQHWCHPTEPDCARCPLTADCAKRM